MSQLIQGSIIGWHLNIFIMQEKLIITLWKAQMRDPGKDDSLYCRLTYNNTERNSKPSTTQKNFVWKETFIFPLARTEQTFRIDFIPLKEGEAIHFAKDQVAESLSVSHAVMKVDVDTPNRGSLPVKLDIFDKQGANAGKIFIEYELMKTEVTYTVEKQLDYLYLLKMTGFKVTFVRRIKNSPKFYLHFKLQGREHKEILAFEQQEPGVYVYNYPVKLYLKKQVEADIILYVKQEETFKPSGRDNQSESDYSESFFSEKKTFKSSVGKKDKMFLDLSQEKVLALLDLNFKRDVKVNRKLPLSTVIKYQKRDIGHIEFKAQTFFRSKEELQVLEEQKKGLNPEKDMKLEKKKSAVKQSNGIITINSILGKLELFNESLIEGRNMSIELKLGQATKESSVLEKPGKEIIFIDTFTFKRTWEQTIKLIIIIHHGPNEKLPTFFADVNLRDLFERGRLTSKKVKLIDEQRNYSGQVILDLEYKEMEEKRSPSLKEEFESISELPHEEQVEFKARKRKEDIVDRIKARQELKEKSRQLNSMSTLAVLESNDILLPPLKNMSRMSTLSPKKIKARGAQCFNVNGSIKFTRSPRFQKPADTSGYESYTYVKQSEFDGHRKRGTKLEKGTSIGYGNKHDFTRDYEMAPGVGRYEIQSVWDKYK